MAPIRNTLGRAAQSPPGPLPVTKKSTPPLGSDSLALGVSVSTLFRLTHRPILDGSRLRWSEIMSMCDECAIFDNKNSVDDAGHDFVIEERMEEARHRALVMEAGSTYDE